MANTPRAMSAVGDPTRYGAVLTAILSATDGATVAPGGGAYAGSGIAVALGAHELRLQLDDSALDVEVARWIRHVAPIVTARGATPARYFGAWRDGDALVLDVVEMFSDIDRELALSAARNRGQRAVYDHGRRECVEITGPATVDGVDRELLAAILDDAYAYRLGEAYGPDDPDLDDVDRERIAAILTLAARLGIDF